MRKFAFAIVAWSLWFGCVAETLYFRGRVVMNDGSLPPAAVTVERVCVGMQVIREAVTNKKTGVFVWRSEADPFGRIALSTSSGTATLGERQCLLRASFSGYVSSIIDIGDRRLTGNPQLPDLVLTRRGPDVIEDRFEDNLPRAAQKLWEHAMAAAQEKNWHQAELLLQEVTAKAPSFVAAWYALGAAHENQENFAEARKAYTHAIEAAPKLPLSYLFLARLDNRTRDWKSALVDSDEVLKRDPKHRYAEAYLQRAVALANLEDYEQAAASAREAIRLDTHKQFPSSEYVLGSILEAQHDLAAARASLQKYLDQNPRASDAGKVRARLANLGASRAPQIAFEMEPAETELAIEGEAAVPGGIRAISVLAHLPPTSYGDFFGAFTQAITAELAPWNGAPIPDLLATLQEFMASAVELGGMGERSETGTTVRLSLADGALRARTERILLLLGWRVVERDGSARVEPGDLAVDGLRQQIPAALGVDEIDMQEALEAGRTVQFEVLQENARLLGGAGWNALLKKVPLFPGGMADLFTRDSRFSKAYAGLSAMPPEAASALLKSAGLRAMVLREAEALWLFGAAVRMEGDCILPPGGAAAGPVWALLAGVNPHETGAFLRALFEKDEGRLAAFYYALSGADAAHQQFFLQTAKRAGRFYAWYRDSDELRWGIARRIDTWRASIFRDLPLDASGRCLFPGGRTAWGPESATDDDLLMGSESVEALIPITRVEAERKRNLDEESVRTIAAHYADWRFLFPYFEQLPGLGPGEFQALARFTETVASDARPERNRALGTWFSLVELIAIGTKSGAIDATAGARAFGRACDRKPALTILRELAGEGSGLDGRVAGLLRLTGEHRAAFDRVRTIENAPRLDDLRSPQDERVLTSLVGLVYAARLDPDRLLVSEDPTLFTRHHFADGLYLRHPALFLPTALIPASGAAGGAAFSGGFMNIGEVAGALERKGVGGEARESPAPVVTGPMDTGSNQDRPDIVFRADGRLVEINATVQDGRGRYLDDIEPDQFSVLEDGEARPIAAFEPRSSRVACALLLDTTGSMRDALAALRSAAIALIDDLRPEDQLAVYSFNRTVTELSPFTSDKAAAKRAVMRTREFGDTAMHDALVRVMQDLEGRPGKKVIVVFTDGADNSSTLTSSVATRKAKAAGIPIYTIAQGEASRDPGLLKNLTAISRATGGLAYRIDNPREIRAVFDNVSHDLTHGYWLAFQPKSSGGRDWHNITVVLKTRKHLSVRAREGYYSE